MSKQRYPICAVASPAGRSAVCVVRLSGLGSLVALEKVFRPNLKKFFYLAENPRVAILGNLYFEETLIDEVIVIPFVAPYSYTGEEGAEIHTHGNPIIIKKLLEILYKLGIQKAAPGEFTKRAFLSGKFDLTQAEAIHEIVQAKSEQGLQKALQLKEGSFRKILLSFRSELINLLADISAELDFTEEGITFVEENIKVQIIKNLIHESKYLIQTSKQLKIFREGVEIVIAGAPNTGKSSLLNFFAGEERAIVSKIPGTTRDYIQIELQISGIPVYFLDTAGIHELKNINEHTEIEKIGIEKSINKLKDADIIIWMIDGSEKVGSWPLETIKCEAEYLFVVNKKDILHSSWKHYRKTAPLQISLQTGENTKTLKEALNAIVMKKTTHTAGIMLSAWQTNILSQIQVGLAESQSLIEAQEMKEIIVSSLQIVLDDLSQLTGDITNEEILGRIFSRFCIGK